MAEFKTGDKVRIIASAEALEAIWAPREAAGVEGTITDVAENFAMVKTSESLDGNSVWAYDFHMLEKIDG